MPAPRMFKILVLGGISLVGAQACGGSESSTSDATPSDGAAEADTYFPSELPAYIDTGTDAHDASVDTTPETFPSELPTFIDSGTSGDGG